MTFQEINKMIDGYKDSDPLEKSIKELLRTVAQQAYEAGQLDGLHTATDIMKKVNENAENIPF